VTVAPVRAATTATLHGSAAAWTAGRKGRASPILEGTGRTVGVGPLLAGGELRHHFNCKRILGDKVLALADAMAPGEHGDPFAGLSTHQREELTSLYLQGFPRGDEFMIGEPMGQMWLWSALADSLQEQDPADFENFWSKPGYVGHDNPEQAAASPTSSRPASSSSDVARGGPMARRVSGRSRPPPSRRRCRRRTWD
jgi:hypothetical protein